MSANWKAGDKAVCVDSSPGRYSKSKELVLGAIYLVQEIDDYSCPEILLRIAGIKPPVVRGYECWFRQSRFRKLIPACDRDQIEAEATA